MINIVLTVGTGKPAVKESYDMSLNSFYQKTLYDSSRCAPGVPEICIGVV